jgi:hypothetical protein
MRCGLLAFPLLAVLAGCSVNTTGDMTLRIPISGGILAPLNFSNGNPVYAETAGIRIDKANFVQAGKELSGHYDFGFVEKQGDVPRRVAVDDVTDPDGSPVNWVDDEHPQLKAGHWEAIGRTIGFDEPALQWLRELDTSVRVYRFTIVNGDGTTTVIYDAGVYPAAVKEFFKKQIDDAAAPPAPKTTGE